MLRKFLLHESQFLSVGLNGLEAEIRFTALGKTAYVLAPAEFRVLFEGKLDIFREALHLSTSLGFYGGCCQRKCVPDMSTGGLKFILQDLPDAQPFNFDEFTQVEYELSESAALEFVKLFPKINEFLTQLENRKPAISLAYQVVKDQMTRLCSENPGSESDEHFMLIMCLLHQQTPISVLVKDFKQRSLGTLIPVKTLMENVLCQFLYLRTSVYMK